MRGFGGAYLRFAAMERSCVKMRPFPRNLERACLKTNPTGKPARSKCYRHRRATAVARDPKLAAFGSLGDEGRGSFVLQAQGLFNLQFSFKRVAAVTAGLAMVVGIGAYGAGSLKASDHQDSPLTVSRPGIDITDVFVYPSPHDPNAVVLAMDVSPLIPTGMGSSRSFDPGAMYQFKIGTANDFNEDLVVQFKATGIGASQKLTMYGPAKPNMQGVLSTFVAPTGTFDFDKPTTLANDVHVYAGPREDPFYFDLAQFFKILPDRDFHNQPNPPAPSAMCFRKDAQDYLAGFNVLQIAVEMPRRLLADRTGDIGRINVWTTTSLPTSDETAGDNSPYAVLANVKSNLNKLLGGKDADTAGTYTQVERLARPAIKEATENFADHDKTNRSPITNDTVLANSIHSYMLNVAHRSPQIADAAVKVLIPDAIEADLSAPGPARYLAVETNGKSGLPVAVVRLVPPPLIYGVKRALGDPYRHFGGRDLRSPVIDLSLGSVFGSLIPKLGLAPDDGKETPCLTSDNTTPAAKHYQNDFPYAGAPR